MSYGTSFVMIANGEESHRIWTKMKLWKNGGVVQDVIAQTLKTWVGTKAMKNIKENKWK
tara:strand:+ start:915 stop:1091 length:177 start_codon:yes stop_codon:yes gene_type:complete